MTRMRTLPQSRESACFPADYGSQSGQSIGQSIEVHMVTVEQIAKYRARATVLVKDELSAEFALLLCDEVELLNKQLDAILNMSHKPLAVEIEVNHEL